jgi:hypothetical protein
MFLLIRKNNKNSKTNIIIEFFSGATRGFGEGEKIGNMDK